MRERLASRSQILGRELFLERSHSPSRATLVLGSGRSGTTWLAETIGRRHRSRLLFEPFHPLLGALGEGLRLFLSPPERDPSFEHAVDRVLSGRVRSVHMDQILTTRLPRGRVVKDVHAANLLPWLRANYPDLPIVFAVRNPIAASLSRLRSDTFYGLGDYLATPKGRREAEASPVAAWLPTYDEHRSHGEALVRLVAEWCIENVQPLSHVDDKGVALAFYEDVVLAPVSELTRLGIFCAGSLGPPRDEPADGEVRTPSAMDWHGTAADARRTGDWRGLLDRWTGEVPRPVLDACLGVLSDFELDGLYGDGPLPLSETPAP